MTSPSDRLSRLDLTLPRAAKPAFNYVPVIRHADLIMVSGQLPKIDGEVEVTGTVGHEVTVEEAQRSARICTLQGLACVADFLGSLDQVDRVLRLTGFVASAPDFHDQPKVIDAASDLLKQLFEEQGRHARSAVGVAALPRRAPVEIEFMFAARTTTRSARGGTS